MASTTTSDRVLRSGEGRAVDMGGFGARFLLSGDAMSLVEHPVAPRTLAAPLHTHVNEDEYTLVLEGELGVQIGDEVMYATAGDLVFKPRGIPHAFWNRSAEPARVLELIAPPAFAAYFEEIAPLLPPNRPAPDFEALGAVMARYELAMDRDSIAAISQREGLPLPPV